MTSSVTSGYAPAATAAGARLPAGVAWLVCGLSMALIACASVLAVLNGSGVKDLIFFPGVATSAVVGGMVASRRPANPLGWFFLGSALSFAVVAFTGEYAVHGQLTSPGSLPLAGAMAWPPSWLWAPGAVLILVFVPLYFPNGRLVSRRWHPVAWLAVFGCVSIAALSAFRPGEIQSSGLINPLGIEALQRVVDEFEAATLPLWLGLLVLSAASLVVRFRRSGREERQQIKWLGLAAAVVPVWFFISDLAAVDRVAPIVFEVTDGLVLSGIPVAAGIAILRYRLYDIDFIINRTLVYGALTACIVGIYVVVVGYLGALFRVAASPSMGSGQPIAISLVATGVVAVVFAPLRERLQRGVNRLLYGERDEPYDVLSRLGQRLKGTISPEVVLPIIVEVVAGALKLPYAAIALKRESGELETVAARGSPIAGKTLRLPLAYGTEIIGQLILSPRTTNERFSPADRRLIDDLARYAEMTVHAVRLTADLQRSRQRVVNAREEERRRLRRDLHDGLGPQLAILPLKLDAARNLLAREPAAAAALLAELKAQAQGTISDIRRLVYDLRPPALDELGLVPAIREQATNCSQNGLVVSVEAPQQLPPLPAATEVAAYRIVQEALTNVARHARARTCRISLSVGEWLTLEVTDDGAGLAEPVRVGVGLSSMRERAAELGGTCEVTPLPAGGTRVRARLPLPDWREQP